MTELELKDFRKEVKRAKRIASEHAMELHDLVEDRLPAAYLEIPEIAQACFDACQKWAELNQQLQELEQAQPA